MIATFKPERLTDSHFSIICNEIGLAPGTTVVVVVAVAPVVVTIGEVEADFSSLFLRHGGKKVEM